jgi:hypothetical protein
VVSGPVEVVLTETLNIDASAQTCTRRLTETVTAQFEGTTFKHFAGDPQPVAADFAVCNAIASQTTPP